MDITTREKLEKAINLFVIGNLKGRYHEFVSDQFLAALLIQQLQYRWADIEEDMGNIVYYVGCSVFADILENHCNAGGSGHHVAQDFSKFLTEQAGLDQQ